MSRFIFVITFCFATLSLSQEMPPTPPVSIGDEETPLMLAIEANDLAKVKQLVEAGADVNESGFSMDSPIRLAVKKQNVKIVHYLVENGAEDNYAVGDAVSQNNMAITKYLVDHHFHIGQAIVYAAENNNLEMVRFLASRGADVDFSQKRKTGIFRRTFVSPIGQAVYHNNLKMTKVLIAHGLPLETAIKEALDYGRNDIILDLSKQLDDKGWLLMEAFKRSNDPLVQKLISQGVPPNVEDDDGNTMLLIAASNGDLELVKKCLNDYNLYLLKKNNFGENALMKAVYSGSIPLCRYLLEKGIDIEAQNNKGETALFYSMSNQSMELFEFLLTSRANPKHASNNGNNLLIKAAIRDNQRAMTTLLARGVDIHHKNKEGKTAFFYVVNNSNGFTYPNNDLHNRFIDAGADINTVGSSGETLLFKMIERGKLDRVKELIHKGADANTTNNRGERPSCSNPEIIKLLVESGADINGTDNWDNTYLCEAVKQNDLELAFFLVNSGIDVNKRCYFDEQALIKAIKSDNLTFVQFLVENGADLDLSGYMHQGVMDYAKKENNEEVISYLRSKGAMTKEEKNEQYKAFMKLERDIKSALIAEDLELVMKLISSEEVIVLQDKTIENIAYVAAKHGHVPMINKLLSDAIPFEINASVTPLDQTVLFIATIYEQDELILDLLSKGADPNHTDRNGKKPIDFAAKRSTKKIFKKWSKDN